MSMSEEYSYFEDEEFSQKEEEYRQHIEEVRQAILDVAKLPQGKVLLRWLVLEECGFMTASFPRDEKSSIWIQAKRDVALKIVRNVIDAGISDILNNNNITKG